MSTTQEGKLRVAVLYGGQSDEHEISLISAACVIANLDKTKYEVIPIGIDKQGHWFLNELAQIFVDQHTPLKLTHARSSLIPLPQTRTALIAKQFPTQNQFDVVFPVLHGPYGEDGTVQGLLELANTPYVGAGVLGNAVAMDKDISKRLIQQAGIPTADFVCLRDYEFNFNPANCIEQIERQLTYPLFAKPANLGSSVGIHKISNGSELIVALQDAFKFDSKVIIEQAINAREIECAVLESLDYGKQPLVAKPGEIVVNTSHDFYDYDAKYNDPNGAQLNIPADLTAEQIAQAQQLARDVFISLGCEAMARVDLFLDKDTGQWLFNELNTIPGFTPISLYPSLWREAGLSTTDLVSHLVELAIARHKRKHFKQEL